MIRQTKIGIMQGRLLPSINGKIQSFPLDTWEQEFALARDAGVGGIEFIFEADQWQRNPLLSSVGRETIRGLMTQYHLDVDTVCLDYFMEHCFWKNEATAENVLLRLMGAAADVGAKILNLPLLGSSVIEDSQGQELARARILQIAPELERNGLRMAVETSLPPVTLHAFLHRIGHPLIGINYDTGNSAYFGHVISEEMAEYGHHVCSVHIKDCLRAQPSVRLGTGATDFESFFSALAKLEYGGPIVLQSARTLADPVEDVREQIRFVRQWLAKYPLVHQLALG